MVQFQLPSQAKDFEQQEKGAFGGQQKRIQRDERHFDESWFFKVEIEASQSRRGRGGGKGKEREQKTILPLITHYKHWQMSKVNTASFQFGARSPA